MAFIIKSIIIIIIIIIIAWAGRAGARTWKGGTPPWESQPPTNHNVPNRVSYSGLGIALCESTLVWEYRC